MDSIDKLTNIFRKFPTVGSRTAGRFVYYLMKLPKDRIDELIGAILELKNKIKLCAGSIVVSISGFQPDDPGSIPGWRISIIIFKWKIQKQNKEEV